VTGPRGGGAGGYLEHLFRFAARELFGVTVTDVTFTQGRNADAREAVLEVDGRVVLRFATAYGFRNIQNLVRKVKSGKSLYHFVEIMACPSGTCPCRIGLRVMCACAHACVCVSLFFWTCMHLFLCARVRVRLSVTACLWRW
jgi:hypothetical protein